MYSKTRDCSLCNWVRESEGRCKLVGPMRSDRLVWQTGWPGRLYKQVRQAGYTVQTGQTGRPYKQVRQTGHKSRLDRQALQPDQTGRLYNQLRQAGYTTRPDSQAIQASQTGRLQPGQTGGLYKQVRQAGFTSRTDRQAIHTGRSDRQAIQAGRTGRQYLLWWCPFKIKYQNLPDLYFSSTDRLSLLSTRLRIRWAGLMLLIFGRNSAT